MIKRIWMKIDEDWRWGIKAGIIPGIILFAITSKIEGWW